MNFDISIRLHSKTY